MRMSIERFMECFEFSEMAIQGLKDSSFNEFKGRYNLCSIEVYRGEGCINFKGKWFIDFNKGYCWLDERDQF